MLVFNFIFGILSTGRDSSKCSVALLGFHELKRWRNIDIRQRSFLHVLQKLMMIIFMYYYLLLGLFSLFLTIFTYYSKTDNVNTPGEGTGCGAVL